MQASSKCEPRAWAKRQLKRAKATIKDPDRLEYAITLIEDCASDYEITSIVRRDALRIERHGDPEYVFTANIESSQMKNVANDCKPFEGTDPAQFGLISPQSRALTRRTAVPGQG